MSVFGDTFARPDRQGPGTMDNEVEARSERVCDHVRRSLAGIGNLLMENRRNTVKEIDPRTQASQSWWAVHFSLRLRCWGIRGGRGTLPHHGGQKTWLMIMC